MTYDNQTFWADSFFCGSSAINWTNLTGSSAPVNDMCNADSSFDEYTYRPDRTVLTCSGRSNKQVITEFCADYFHLGFGDNPLRLNVPSLSCLYGGANCDKVYCQTCPGICAWR